MLGDHPTWLSRSIVYGRLHKYLTLSVSKIETCKRVGRSAEQYGCFCLSQRYFWWLIFFFFTAARLTYSFTWGFTFPTSRKHLALGSVCTFYALSLSFFPILILIGSLCRWKKYRKLTFSSKPITYTCSKHYEEQLVFSFHLAEGISISAYITCNGI